MFRLVIVAMCFMNSIALAADFPFSGTYETKCTTIPPGKQALVSSFQNRYGVNYLSVVSRSFYSELAPSAQIFDEAELEIRGDVAHFKLSTLCAIEPNKACCP